MVERSVRESSIAASAVGSGALFVLRKPQEHGQIVDHRLEEGRFEPPLGLVVDGWEEARKRMDSETPWSEAIR
jgi:hypothetical protein